MVHVTAIWLPEYLACRVIRRRYGLGREVGHAHLPALGLEHTYPQIHNLHNHPFSSNLYLYFAHIHISLPPPPKWWNILPTATTTTNYYYYYHYYYHDHLPPSYFSQQPIKSINPSRATRFSSVCCIRSRVTYLLHKSSYVNSTAPSDTSHNSEYSIILSRNKPIYPPGAMLTGFFLFLFRHSTGRIIQIHIHQPVHSFVGTLAPSHPQICIPRRGIS